MRYSSYLWSSDNLRLLAFLKVEKNSLELHLGTIPGGVRFGGVGPIMIIVKLQLQLPIGMSWTTDIPIYSKIVV